MWYAISLLNSAGHDTPDVCLTQTWKEIEEEEEKKRKERVKSRAAQRFRESSLPPRMAEHERRRKEQEEQQKKLEATGGTDVRASLTSTRSSTRSAHSTHSATSGKPWLPFAIALIAVTSAASSMYSDIKIGRDPPDFKKLHEKLEKSLQMKKKTRPVTKSTKPFSFDTEEKR